VPVDADLQQHLPDPDSRPRCGFDVGLLVLERAHGWLFHASPTRSSRAWGGAGRSPLKKLTLGGEGENEVETLPPPRSPASTVAESPIFWRRTQLSESVQAVELGPAHHGDAVDVSPERATAILS